MASEKGLEKKNWKQIMDLPHLFSMVLNYDKAENTWWGGHFKQENVFFFLVYFGAI
jgi:hypothetical protein